MVFVEKEAENVSKNLQRLQAEQKATEDAQWLMRFQSVWNAQDPKRLIAYELYAFLQKELPKTEGDIKRFHLYQLSPDLKRKFAIRLIEKGLIKVDGL